MRELKTRQQISDWINERLQAVPECADATVSVQYELREPAPDGCNWSEDLVLNYGTSKSEAVRQHLRPLQLGQRPCVRKYATSRTLMKHCGGRWAVCRPATARGCDS